MKKVAIIGAGASGLFAALRLCKKLDVTIYEKLNILGKKLSLTGNGKGNITNLNMNSNYYNHNLDNLLKEFTPDFLRNLLLEYNIYTKVDNEGRVYPYTSAKDFTEIIVSQIKNNCKIINDEVKEIKDNYVISNNNKIKYDYIILSTGSKSQVKGYTKVKTGLKDIEFKAGLTPIKVDNKYIKGLSGLRNKSRVSLYLDDKLIHSELGEVQFRDDSISGIVIFQMSSIIARLNYKTKYLLIDLLPDINNLEEVLNDIKKRNLFYTITDSLKSLLPPKLVLRIIELNNIKNIMKDVNINDLCMAIKNFRIDLLNNLGFENSQVSVGGILLDEINLKTFESKIKNLYVIGEALDVDGLCGGYNLHFAFMSAYYASKAIGELCL